MVGPKETLTGLEFKGLGNRDASCAQGPAGAPTGYQWPHKPESTEYSPTLGQPSEVSPEAVRGPRSNGPGKSPARGAGVTPANAGAARALPPPRGPSGIEG